MRAPGERRVALRRRTGMGEEQGGSDEHWRFWLFYVNADDSRILVPKRHKWMGYTFNFAHRESYVLTAGLLGIAAAAVLQKKIRRSKRP
jgi:uncharacterized membrane protein